MATIKTYSDHDLRLAKKAGFKLKKPALKKTGTYNQIISRVSRYNQWVEKLKAKAKQGRELEKIKASIDKARMYS